jgi:hypothetical protein
MKKIIFIMVVVSLRATVFGQTNTLPTSGNVGIGTTTPYTLLQVKGGAFQQINLDNYSGIYLDATNTNQPKVGFRVSDNSERFRIHLQDINTVTERLAILKNLSGEAEVLSLLSSGKVGIGTSNPNALLDVGQTISNGQLGTVFARMAEGNTNGDGTYLGVKAWGTQQAYNGKSFSIEHSFYGYKNSAINFYRGGAMQLGYMTFETNDGSERMRIDNYGRVGIGSTNPINQLDVYSPNNDPTIRVVSGNAGALITTQSTNSFYAAVKLIGNNGTQNWSAGMTNGNSNYSVSGSLDGATNRFFNIIYNGNVGIGLEVPQGKLDVAYTGGTSNFGSTAGGNNFLWTRSTRGSVAL